MSQESVTPDLVERARLAIDAIGGRDLDAAMSFYAPHAVLEAVVGRFEGLAAIRGFLDDWLASYEEFEAEAEEVVALGNGVTFGVFRQSGRLVGSNGQVQLRFALAAEWSDGVMVRAITNPEIDAGRAAAERLAEERE
jgi:ketosteroid isomerase-like protein